MHNITDSWFVQGMIKATSDAWLKGWDERNGGNLTLRLDEADIAPFAADFHAKPRYIALSQPMPMLANTPFIVTGSGKFFRNVQIDAAGTISSRPGWITEQRAPTGVVQLSSPALRKSGTA